MTSFWVRDGWKVEVSVCRCCRWWRRGQDSNREGKTYLEEAWGHGTTWHGVVRGHVAHHWAGRCRCALKHINTVIKCGVFCLSVSVCASDSSTIISMYMMHWPENYYRGQCLHLQSQQTPTPLPLIQSLIANSEKCPLLQTLNCSLISVVERKVSRRNSTKCYS